MNGKINKFATLNQDLYTDIKKSTIFIKIFNIYCRFFLHASSCDQLSLHSEYHTGIFLLNIKTNMSN